MPLFSLVTVARADDRFSPGVAAREATKAGAGDHDSANAAYSFHSLRAIAGTAAIPAASQPVAPAPMTFIYSVS
jgi:hypothetical protein